ncbi:hypothetical protein M3650_14715 [Paenibacillus sp. MER TA 81-3]|uniref:hypothetical protein n=1 Tax=Paenibacillus sp. MER TA 81-3 TaxID=2939573 RepID=UPI00203F3008|nr:hypothetical protein [Paenibacillus sp. MER TA 81-3]MCM3339847.1 hypothetical protein [Paenibacillus sp. MER TA 81-3]
MLGKEEIEHRLEQLLTVSDDEEQLAKQAAGLEAEIDHKLNQLADNVSHPEVTDLIYWSDENYSAEQIVDMALAYRPIIAPPAPDRV